VGFAAESQNLLATRTAKRARKGVPLLVGNLGPSHLRPRRQRAAAGGRAGRASELPRAAKLTLARQLIAEIARPRHHLTTSNIDVKILDARMATSCPPTPRPAAPGWTCAPAWTPR
jgi:hypothetical protein